MSTGVTVIICFIIFFVAAESYVFFMWLRKVSKVKEVPMIEMCVEIVGGCYDGDVAWFHLDNDSPVLYEDRTGVFFTAEKISNRSNAVGVTIHLDRNNPDDDDD